MWDLLYDMNRFSLYSSVSPWFILLCLLIGAFYAYILYSKRKPLWSNRTNLFLGSLRFILVSLLVYLLFGPVIRYFENSSDKPLVLIHIDNSESLKYSSDSLKRRDWIRTIHTLTEDLGKEGIETAIYTFNGKQHSEKINFHYPITDLNILLQKPKQEVSGRNISASILVSDGIYNAGMDPSITPSSIPVFTIGIGDTSTKRDIQLKSALYNKISYKGNQFPILAEIAQTGFNNKAVTIQLKQKGKVLESKKINLSKAKIQDLIEFKTIGENIGIQHYTLETLPLQGEFTTENNIQHIYVEVVDNKEKILIAAPSPHPDIKAIQAALSVKDNIDITVFIPGITSYKEDNYSLIILHHYPDGSSTNKKEFDKLMQSNIPKWIILSNQTNISLFNQTNSLLQIQLRGNQKDLVFGEINPSFDRFIMPPGMQELLQGAPPLQCTFGDYKLTTEANVLLNQRIGRVSTQKPLLAVSSSKDEMVLAGEGIWQWRLYEQSFHQNTKTFDEFVQKCVQYLSNDNNKRKFRVYPSVNDIQEGEKISFEAELYNDIMERVYGTEIKLQIKNESGKIYLYAFTTSNGNNRFEISGLKEGLYSYVATAILNGRNEKTQGEFIVRKTSLEAQNTKADFNLLKSISLKSNGAFYFMDRSDDLLKEILNRKFKTIIRSKETLSEIINIPWIFFLLITLISIEWILRKVQGGY